MLVQNSLIIAGVVTVVSVAIAFFGALAFARYDWKGRRLFQKLVLLPIFFPQPVLGLALLLWFNALGIPLSMKTAIIAHLVWIAPVATLVMAIQTYSFDPTLEDAAFDLGANRWQVLTEVTIPILWPGIWSGMLFAFLLSWGNFSLSLYTAGADATVPEWLYNKMIAGYTPMVPALGTMSTLTAAAVMILGALVIYVIQRRRAAAQNES
jgi:spermidine/putrescine transport system permease protein